MHIVAEGGIQMKTLLIAVLLFITFHFIRIDLLEGTIPLASFAEQPNPCEEIEEIGSIPVTTMDGDTIDTLFAMYPIPEMGFIDRLAYFYQLNPHLQNQEIIGGLQIRLPIAVLQIEECNDNDK